MGDVVDKAYKIQSPPPKTSTSHNCRKNGSVKGDRKMRRGARLDAPGTLYHVMVRGLKNARSLTMTTTGKILSPELENWALIREPLFLHGRSWTTTLIFCLGAGPPVCRHSCADCSGGMRHPTTGGTIVTGICFKTGTSKLSARKIPISGNSFVIFI